MTKPVFRGRYAKIQRAEYEQEQIKAKKIPIQVKSNLESDLIRLTEIVETNCREIYDIHQKLRDSQNDTVERLYKLIINAYDITPKNTEEKPRKKGLLAALLG